MGRFATVILILAAVSLIMKAIIVAFMLLLLVALIFRPKETFGLLALGGLVSAFQAQPLITTCAVAGLLAFGYYSKRKEEQSRYRDD